jgi:hypothetical protein
MVSPIEEAEEFYQRENNKIKMLETQLIEVMKNNVRLAEENRMYRDFISKVGGKIQESVEHVPDFKHHWSENPDQRSYRTFRHYDIDRFRFILDNPSKSIIEMWEKLMENGVLDTYDREHNKAFMKLDLSKVNDSDYFYIAAEISRLIRKNDR